MKITFVCCCLLVATLCAAQSGVPAPAGMSEKIKSFKYTCEGIIGDEGVQWGKLQIVKFNQNAKVINLEFTVTTNCGNRGRGYLLVHADTLVVVDNRGEAKTIEVVDSTGRKKLVEVWEEPVMSCDCFSRYRYELRHVREKIRFFCFRKECIAIPDRKR